MIERLAGFPPNVIAFGCRAQVTKADYSTTLVPAVEKAFAEHVSLRLYYEIGDDFAGIDLGAMLEDFKVGIAHRNSWERMALVTDVPWIAHAVSLFRVVLPCPVKLYAMGQAAQARAWIAAPLAAGDHPS